MIAVIFELEPRAGLAQRYFDLADELKASLMGLEGSFPFAHRTAQREGRSQVFSDYRLRVANVIRDYGLASRDQAPSDSLDALR